MSRYFINFPKVKYELANSSFSATKVVSNITLKTTLQKTLPQNDPSLYQRYLVKENERAEDIAEFYYGNVNLVWLVYFSNQIIDPYTQWPKSSSDFNKYFVKKYASKSQPDGTDPIVWGQNTTRTDNIVRWEQIEQQPDENGFTKDVVVSAISPDSYTHAQIFNNSGVVTSNGTTKYISGITQANPAVVTTTTDHGFTQGNTVTITDVKGMTEVNNNDYVVNNITTKTFELSIDSTEFTSYTTNTDFIAGDWAALRYYNYELNLNEELRSIVLINDVYSNMAEENLKRLLNV